MATGATRTVRMPARPDLMSPPPCKSWKRSGLEQRVQTASRASGPFREWTREDARLFSESTLVPLQESTEKVSSLKMGILKAELILNKYFKVISGFKGDIGIPLETYKKVKKNHCQAVAVLAATLMSFAAFGLSLVRLITTIAGAIPALLFAVFVLLPMKAYLACIEFRDKKNFDKKTQKILGDLITGDPKDFPQRCQKRVQAIFNDLRLQKGSPDYYKNARKAGLMIVRALPREQDKQTFMDALNRGVAAEFFARPSQKEWHNISRAGFEQESFFNDALPQLTSQLQENNAFYFTILQREKGLLAEKERQEATLHRLEHECPSANREKEAYHVEKARKELAFTIVQLCKVKIAKDELEEQSTEGTHEWLNLRAAALSVDEEPTLISETQRRELYEEIPSKEDDEELFARFFEHPNEETFQQLKRETASLERDVFYALVQHRLPRAVDALEERRRVLEESLSKKFADKADRGDLEVNDLREENARILEISAFLEYLEKTLQTRIG